MFLGRSHRGSTTPSWRSTAAPASSREYGTSPSTRGGTSGSWPRFRLPPSRRKRSQVGFPTASSPSRSANRPTRSRPAWSGVATIRRPPWRHSWRSPGRPSRRRHDHGRLVMASRARRRDCRAGLASRPPRDPRHARARGSDPATQPGARAHTHRNRRVMIVEAPARIRYYEHGDLTFESPPGPGPEPPRVIWMDPEGRTASRTSTPPAITTSRRSWAEETAWPSDFDRLRLARYAIRVGPKRQAS